MYVSLITSTVVCKHFAILASVNVVRKVCSYCKIYGVSCNSGAQTRICFSKSLLLCCEDIHLEIKGFALTEK